MKKYNCNNTLDYAHEFNRMCDTFHCSSDCPLCVLPCGAVKNITSEHIRRVQAWSDAHPEIMEITLTDKQIEILKALNLLGFSYIARDSGGEIYAYTEHPKKTSAVWACTAGEYFNFKYFREEISDALSSLISWDDDEPLYIADLLAAFPEEEKQ